MTLLQAYRSYSPTNVYTILSETLSIYFDKNTDQYVYVTWRREQGESRR